MKQSKWEENDFRMERLATGSLKHRLYLSLGLRLLGWVTSCLSFQEMQTTAGDNHGAVSHFKQHNLPNGIKCVWLSALDSDLELLTVEATGAFPGDAYRPLLLILHAAFDCIKLLSDIVSPFRWPDA